MPAKIVAPSANACSLGRVCVWAIIGLMLTGLFAAQFGEAFQDTAPALARAG
jgi:hypothetical protein